MTDVNGWPRVYVEPPVAESGDRPRILNWGLERFKDFRAMCEKHRELTEEAKRNGCVKAKTSFADLFLGTVKEKQKENKDENKR